jgi:hypothetical protein
LYATVLDEKEMRKKKEEKKESATRDIKLLKPRLSRGAIKVAPTLYNPIQGAE